MSLRVDYDERAIDQAAAFLDDPPGIRAVLDAIDRLGPAPGGQGGQLPFPFAELAQARWRRGLLRPGRVSGRTYSAAVARLIAALLGRPHMAGSEQPLWLA